MKRWEVLLPSADTKLLEQAERQLFDRFWGMSMSELRHINHAEMHSFAMQFREVMYEMPFRLPHNLLLLGRTVLFFPACAPGSIRISMFGKSFRHMRKNSLRMKLVPAGKFGWMKLASWSKS